MAQFLTDATFAGNVAINGSTGITGLNGITFENGCILDDSIGAEYLKLKYNGANAGGMQIFDNENTEKTCYIAVNWKTFKREKKALESY